MLQLWLFPEDGAQGVLVGVEPVEDVLEDLVGAVLGTPAGGLGDVGIVGEVEGDVGVAVLGFAGDGDGVAGEFAAEGAHFAEGGADVASAADVEGLAGEGIEVVDLVQDELEEVVDVEHVAYLFAGAAVADVFEGTTEEVAGGPEHDDALVDFAHLPGSGEDAAAVGETAQVVHGDVFGEEVFGAEFGRAVEGTCAVERKGFGEALGGYAGDVLLGVEFEAGLGFVVGKAADGLDGVDAAGGEEDHGGVVASCEFEGVDSADQVGVDEVVGGAVVSGEYGGFGAAFEDEVDGTERVEIFAVTDITVDKFDTALAQSGQVEFTAASFEVVKGDKSAVAVVLFETEGKVCADESGAAGDEYGVHNENPFYRVLLGGTFCEQKVPPRPPSKKL